MHCRDNLMLDAGPRGQLGVANHHHDPVLDHVALLMPVALLHMMAVGDKGPGTDARVHVHDDVAKRAALSNSLKLHRVHVDPCKSTVCTGSIVGHVSNTLCVQPCDAHVM